MLLRSLITVLAASLLTGADTNPLRFPEMKPMPNGPVPFYNNGYFIVRNSLIQTPNDATIRLFHAATRSWREFNIWPPEPVEAVFIKRAFVLPDGRLVAGLRVISPVNERAEVLAVFSQDGKRLQWFRTNPFVWDTFAIDGESVWMLGLCSDQAPEECKGSFPLLRQYSLDGKIMTKALDAEPSLPPLDFVAASYAWIFPQPDRVHLFLPKQELLLSFDRSGSLSSRERIAEPATTTALSMAMTTGQRLLMSGSGIAGVHEWNRQSAAWVAIPSLEGRLYGIEENRIVTGSYVFGEATLLTKTPLQ